MESENPGACLPELNDNLIATLGFQSPPTDVQTNGFIAAEGSGTECATVPLHPDGHLEREASLLMFYLDHVFPSQLPLLMTQESTGGRYWLLSLLTSTKPVYYATLSLAALHYKRAILQDGADESRYVLENDHKRFYVIALQELQVAMDELNLSNDKNDQRASIAALACIWQLICLECTISRAGTWAIHLDAASALIPAVMTHMKSHLRNRSPSTPPFAQEAEPSSEVVAAQNFLLRWTFELSNECLQLEQISGCDDWVVSIIRETIELEKWKRSAKRQRTLRVRDLASRAVDIEQRLEKRISDMFGPKDGFVDHLRSLMSETPRQRRAFSRNGWRSTLAHWRRASAFCITYLYALTTMTYLHVVVDGFKPDLPEIEESVSRAVSAISNFPDISLSRHLLLPMCYWIFSDGEARSSEGVERYTRGRNRQK
ncbi:hypothetical protein AJ80_02443 [Polytolypa hystricis UAMH7299]|uniref:Transcription factor domain-containing protein n=1 Tax=Polytolypa hystricis (strain UAMH7299) TaxID=1447883 RepID=A0A2B7YR37_POLH7|nr:hypothetical protein AJ80_02443 [Polytolypa hystricis UAMH7299]